MERGKGSGDGGTYTDLFRGSLAEVDWGTGNREFTLIGAHYTLTGN